MNLDHLKTVLTPKINELGYELYDVEFVTELKKKILRISIDNDSIITVDDCQIVSNGINDFLDELDPIPGEYYLEVSSPGAERELRKESDYNRFLGYFVHLETFEQTLEGELFENHPETIILRVRGKNIKISKIDIQKIRLAIKF